ncbi:MAG: hypothetical protein ACI9R3_005522 [Verrucomicrobiales bacterium]|jgi:hypothetical protein
MKTFSLVWHLGRTVALLSVLSGAWLPCILPAEDKTPPIKKADASALKSGPQVGEAAVPYHPLLATGITVGQRWCMVCTHRDRGNAMVIVFAREQNEVVSELVAAVEAATQKHKKVGGIITFLTTTGKTASEAEALTGSKVVYINADEKKRFHALQEFAKAHKITNTSLNIYTNDGPRGYQLSKEAELTILVADSSAMVKANYALRPSEVTSKRIKQIAQEIDSALSGK